MSTKTACDSKVLLLLTAMHTEYDAVERAVRRWTLECPHVLRSSPYDRVDVECIGIRGGRLRQVLQQ